MSSHCSTFLTKKICRKQKRSLSLLAKHENVDIDDSDSLPSRYLLVSNAGLMCEVSSEQLFQIFSPFGQILDIVLIPSKAFAFIQFSQQSEAMNAFQALNHKTCQQLGRDLNIAFISSKLFDRVFEANRARIETYCALFAHKPNGLTLIPHFITEEEEDFLFTFTKSLFENIEFQDKNKMKNRLVRHFGFEFDYSTNRIRSEEPIEPIPKELDFILNRLLERKLIEEIPDQLTINCYFAGHGIPAHTDTHSMCENCIISVSIGSDIVMQFKNPEDGRQSNVVLPKRSVLLMRDESRYLWTHSISASKSDLIVCNENRLTLSQRKTRISLSLRKVKRNECNCRFPKYCDSREKNEIKDQINEEMSEEKAKHLESKYVHKVYESIANHFSETRYKPWPQVSHFLNSLSKGSLVLDVGCGNGKYLNVNPDIVMIGCDRSQSLLNICREKSNEVFLSDCLQLSVRRLFDAAICIAVLHHLSSVGRRVRALQSLIDTLLPNGKLLLYVWAFEQKAKRSEEIVEREDNEFNLLVHRNGNEFARQELLVPWTTNESERQLRYYHVFREGELEALFESLTDCRVLRVYSDCGNWAAILQRL